MLGERLRLAREKKGWSQVYVASLLNITSQSLSNYERGERDPDTPLLNKLADIYEVSTDYLFGKTNNPKSNATDHVAEDWPEVYNILRRKGQKPSLNERRRIAKILELSIEVKPEDVED
jgi:transcriptional regulator with XRE-family HTH domain